MNITYMPACTGCIGLRSYLLVLWTARNKSLVGSHIMDSMSWSPPIIVSIQAPMRACWVSNIAVVDIINVVSVVMGVNVKQWIESNDDDIQESLYWRQAFNCRTAELSVCNCYNSRSVLSTVSTNILANSRSPSSANVGLPPIPTKR